MMGVPPQPKPNRSTGNSVQGRQIQNPKMNLEDFNIEIDGFSQLFPEGHNLNYISTKKSVSTKNQFGKQKVQTQNLQNLLKDAKREMIAGNIDNIGDQIFVGGDDISSNPQGVRKASKINFNGTQNLVLNNANTQNNHQPGQTTQGYTPSNNQQQHMSD